MSRDMKILLLVIGVCALGTAVVHFSAGRGRRPVVAARPDTRAWATGPAPPRVRGLEKVFYGLYFSGPGISLSVLPGTADQVDCVYRVSNTRMHCIKPLAWHETLLARLANAGITCSEYEFFAEDEYSLGVTWAEPHTVCGTAMMYRIEHPEEFPIAEGNSTEVVAIAIIRSAVADLIARPEASACPSDGENYTRERDLWRRYYGSDWTLSAVLRMAGNQEDDLSERGIKDASDRIEQEFVARYRTVPVASAH